MHTARRGLDLRLHNEHNGVVSDDGPPVISVPVRAADDAEGPRRLSSKIRDRVMVDVIHDGANIPPRFLIDERGEPVAFERYAQDYWIERDWGARLVAEALCRHLGVARYHHVRVARVLMDFGRFPGATGEDADYLDRYAINYPFSSWLGFEQKQRLLAEHYDVIAAHYDRHVRDTITKIAIHTYDKHNRSGTTRPELSVCSQALSYRGEHALPNHFFDPLYPDALAEYTADRVLRDRLSLTIEKAGYRVAHNYPYALPDGSVEVRSQVWSFFVYLQRCFDEAHPKHADAPGYAMVWKMLQDTNLRSTESEALRSHLQLFRHAPRSRERDFDAAQRAYSAIGAFLDARRDELLRDYRLARERLSSIGIEVRKDLVWHFDGDTPVAPNPEAADAIGRVLARALLVYLTEDRPIDPAQTRLEAARRASGEHRLPTR
jgi:hypothetical protein